MIRILSIVAHQVLSIHARGQEPAPAGTMKHIGLRESSGLTISPRYPGILWTHNDDDVGGHSFLFSMKKNGKVISAYVVRQNLIDWEDIASDKAGNLYLADIGSNGMVRTHVAVHRVREPDPFKRYGNVRVDRTWLLRFPEGPINDCESFFLHRGFGYLITKNRENDGVNEFVKLYRFALSDMRRSIPLQLMARIPTDYNVTAADLSDDKQRLALVTTHGVALYFVHGDPASANADERLFFDWSSTTMEGGTFYGNNFLACAETHQLWMFTNSPFLCQDAPRFLGVPLENQIVDAGDSVEFEAFPDGCPFPQLIWRFNGQIIPGATNTALKRTSVSSADAGLYEAVAINRYGTATNAATLTVIVRTGPDVRITEVMSSRAPSPNLQTEDWWELFNFDTEDVDISGWRFNDSPDGFADGFIFPEETVLKLGIPLILVENLLPGEFFEWWGGNSEFAEVLTYTGQGLSFDGDGDEIFLWNRDGELVTHVTFGAADAGVSFIYNPITEAFPEKAQLGVHGVYRARTTSDIGSPGVIEP
jgi:hypothetical protein